MEYNVGDTIVYRTFGGEARTVLVTEKEDDVKNGRPGFDGVTEDGVDVWGYDEQIVSVR